MAEEIEVTIPSDGIDLKGSLLLPTGDGSFPALLYVSGSGPIDRNDNIPGQPLNNSRRIAEHLASLGIASLRYDKRGVAASGGDYLTAGHYDLVNDASSAVQFLCQHSNIDKNRIIVCGHSEGSIVAPQVALKQPLAGIICLSPFCENMETILMMQAVALQNMIDAQRGPKSWIPRILTTLFNQVKIQKRFIRKVKRTNKDTIRFGFQKLPAKWFRETFQLKPRDIYSEITIPSLLIGGDKDFQCDPNDVGVIQGLIGASAEGHVVKNMSHLLREELGEPSIFNYQEQLTQDLMPEVLELIAQWLQSINMRNA